MNSVTTILPMLCLLVVACVRLAGTIVNWLVDKPSGGAQKMAVDQLSNTFAALADPTRRAILGRLAEGEATVNELADPFPITVQAVSKHLKVLERAGLITRGRTAQLRPSRLQGAALKDAVEWLEGYRRFWEGSFDRLEARLRTRERRSGNG
jgi:DNA-binding transcriptional ArsR family regulator